MVYHLTYDMLLLVTHDTPPDLTITPLMTPPLIYPCPPVTVVMVLL